MVLNTKDKVDLYNSTGINTSNQEVLILKCYNGVIGCLKQAREMTSDREKIVAFNENIVKAQKGIGLLAGALNKDAGEVAENLEQLYNFMINYLMKASFKKDAGMIDEIISMMTDMKESWEQAFEKLHQQTGGQQIKANTATTNRSALNIVG